MIEQRVLDLQRGKGDARISNLLYVAGVEIGSTDQIDLALGLQVAQMQGGIDTARLGVIPPMELHQVKAFHAQAPQGAIDDAAHVLSGDRGQQVDVRDKLGVDLESVQCVRAATLQHGRAEVANHFLDAGVDIGAIKRGHASIV